MDNLNYEKSVSSIMILSLVLSIVCAIIIIVAGTLYYYNLLIRSLSETASVAALHTASFVDPYELDQVIIDDCDISWEELQTMFDMILTASRDLLFLYIMVPYGDDRFMYIVSGNMPELRGFVDEPDLYGPEAWQAYFYGEVTATTTPTDAGVWGIVMAAFVPLRNPDGEVIAVLGADIDVSVVHSQVLEFAIALGIICIVLQLIVSIFLKDFIMSVLIDFTKRLREVELHRNVSVQKSETKTRFLAKMSHEIRTPMNVILGLTELQLQKGSLQKEVRGTFLQILRSSKLLLDIINDILDYSKVELGKMEIVQASYDLYSLIVLTLQLNMIYLGDKHIKFEVKVDASQYIELIGDSLRIRQVLNNLLSNAFKYTEEGSVTFTVSYEELDSNNEIMLIFTVKDTGLGMSQEQIDRLYSDDYVRFVTEASVNIEGTGLGMSISNQLVALMGGSLEVESELGVGTVFTFKVKQMKHTEERLGAFRSNKLSTLDYDLENLDVVSQVNYLSLSHSSVLVVDDILSNLVVIKEMLSMYGIQVDTASSGADAVDFVTRKKSYDIIFMDYMMPGMNGIEAMQKLRELGYDKPIIVLTADITNNNEQLFIDNGFDDFLSKPVDIHELDNCLKLYIPGIKEAKKESPQYSEMLISSFLHDANRESRSLSGLLQKQMFDEKSFEDFRISVHGLKSACANVGLMDLSELALRLELASKDRDQNYLMTQTPFFLVRLSEAVSEFSKRSVPHDEVSSSSIDFELFTTMLLRLAEECEAFNAKKVKETIKQMENMECTARMRGFLSETRQLLLHADFETIGENSRSLARELT